MAVVVVYCEPNKVEEIKKAIHEEFFAGHPRAIRLMDMIRLSVHISDIHV